MTRYEFQATLFPTRHAMLSALVYEWMTAGGDNSEDTVSVFCGQITPAELAAQCAEGWDISAEWLAERECTHDDLVAAFRQFCRERPDRNN